MRGHVYRRGRSWTFVVDLGRREDGRRQQKSVGGFPTKATATAAMTKALHELNTGLFVAKSDVTLKEYVTVTWLPSIQGSVRTTTHASYTSLLMLHVLPAIGARRLQDLRAADFTTLYGHLLNEGRRDGKGGLSNTTVRTIHRVLSTLFSSACRNGLLATNPVQHATIPKRTKPTQNSWNQEEVRRFLTATIEDDLYSLYRLAFATGMRRGELLGLRWQDVNLDHGFVHIQQALVATGYDVSLSQPKTERSRRKLTLDRETCSVLRQHRIRQKRQRLALGVHPPDHDLVFSKINGTPLHPMGVSRAFVRRAQALGFPRIRFHDIRHTWATLALSQGIHPKVVSDRLGHSSTSVTLDTYSHAIPSLEVEAAHQVAALFDAGA